MSEAWRAAWGDAANAFLETLPDGVLLVDRTGTIIEANRRAGELFLLEHPDLIGKTVEDLIPVRLRDIHSRHRAGFVEEPETRSMGADLDLVALRADGSPFPVDISLSHMEVADETVVVASVRDMTERRTAARALRAARQRVERLEDRERIARDLHDTVIQDVFGAGLMVQSAIGQVTDPLVVERLEHAVKRLDEGISQLRTVIFDLQNHRDDEDAEDAIESVVQSAAPELGFVPELTVTGDVGRLTSSHMHHLLPTIREALTNVVRHAYSSWVSVTVDVRDETMTMSVVDNGIGIESSNDGDGMGLRNMSERAVALGGSFEISPATDRGTTVRWAIPLAAQAD